MKVFIRKIDKLDFLFREFYLEKTLVIIGE